MQNYLRVIPRDLFNESALLKCYGKLYIHIERMTETARFVEEEVSRFDVVQDAASGDITIANIAFEVRGRRYRLTRPLNAMNSWSFWVVGMDPEDDFDGIEVFTDGGDLTDEMTKFLTAA